LCTCRANSLAMVNKGHRRRAFSCAFLASVACWSLQPSNKVKKKSQRMFSPLKRFTFPFMLSLGELHYHDETSTLWIWSSSWLYMSRNPSMLRIRSLHEKEGFENLAGKITLRLRLLTGTLPEVSWTLDHRICRIHIAHQKSQIERLDSGECFCSKKGRITSLVYCTICILFIVASWSMWFLL
jgi:hypothetical protein